MEYRTEFVHKIYNLPKTEQAVSDFLNSEYIEVGADGSKRVRQMWERFEGAYVKVARSYDRNTKNDAAEVYMYAHKLISRCVLADVSPYFESDGKLFAYFQLMVRNSRINEGLCGKKNEFLLIGDMLGDADDGLEAADYSNFEERVLGCDESGAMDVDSLLDLEDLIDGLECEHDDVSKSDLVLLGRLFINNGFSFDSLYGQCGWSLSHFRLVRRRLIESLRSAYCV